jgi:hypothetical protein
MTPSMLSWISISPSCAAPPGFRVGVAIPVLRSVD